MHNLVNMYLYLQTLTLYKNPVYNISFVNFHQLKCIIKSLKIFEYEFYIIMRKVSHI